MKSLLLCLFLQQVFLFSGEAYSDSQNYKFNSNCKVRIYLNKGKKEVAFADLRFVVKNSRLRFIEMLSCSLDNCHSERVYLKNGDEIESAFKYSGAILEKKYDGENLSYIYVGSDPSHKRKLQLQIKTGDLTLFEFGKTIFSDKDFHEVEKSKCDKVESIFIK